MALLNSFGNNLHDRMSSIFVDSSFLVIKQDKKRFRLDGISASAFERATKLTDGYFSPTCTSPINLISSLINC